MFAFFQFAAAAPAAGLVFSVGLALAGDALLGDDDAAAAAAGAEASGLPPSAAAGFLLPLFGEFCLGAASLTVGTSFFGELGLLEFLSVS